MKVKVRYFAALRDQRGLSQETLDIDVCTPRDVYGLLHTSHQFTLNSSQVRFAVNGAYVEETHTLSEGDELVLIPPVAGG